MKVIKRNKIHDRKEHKAPKDVNDGLSNLMNLKIQNENIHIKNIIRTIYYVYVSKYDSETGFTYIKDILKNIVKGNVYDIEHKKYINEFCICELSARILLNLIKVHVKDVNFSKMVDFLFDMLHYCDVLLEERKSKKSSKDNSNQEYILVSRLWIRLLDNMFTKDKKQRINMCKVLRAYVKKACTLQIDVSDKLCKKHVNIILSLLNDKDHNIRSHCLILLEPFQDSTTIGSYLKCLDDANFVVRITAIKNILINVQDPEYDYITILKNLLIRINDINTNVRESVYEKLKDYYYYIPPDMKFELLICGLNDKEKSVNESCYSMVMHWTRLFNNRMEDLLSHMISSDIDNDVLLEQICRIHLSNVRKGNIQHNSSMLSREDSVTEAKKYNEAIEERTRRQEGEYKLDRRNTSIDETNGSYDEHWFNYCADHILELSPIELYMFRIYVQYFSEEQEREKIDLLQIIRAIYYNVYVSRFNEKLFNYRKIFLSYTSTSPEDSLDYEHIRCECGLSKKDLNTIREEKKKKFMETSVFDETYCNKCIYFRSMLQVEPTSTTSNHESEIEKNLNEDTSGPINTTEKVVEEHVILDEDNMNENYKYLCNVKNLLLICKCLEIIEIYQVEKIIKCCEFVLLKSPLREIILKCMLYHTGVNYYRLQKGNMSCAYWLSNTYVYACVELLKEMVYIKYEKCSVNEIEMNLSKAVLSIISEIKEPFDCTSDEKPLADLSPNNIIVTGGDEEEEKEKKFNRAVRESNGDQSDNSFHMIAAAIMNVDNMTIFEIIRRDHLKTLTIAQLSSVCLKMQGRLDVCEAKIKDLTEMEREKELEREKKEQGDQNEEEQYIFHEQIRFHTQIFLKNITVLSMVRLELKRRWLRILFILECFLCKSKSHCTFDSALREFPNELLLPALYFCCSIMPNWDEKEIEDQFYDIIASKCLGNWSMFIGNDEELVKQIKAYKDAISETCEVISNYLVNIERIHEAIFPDTYTKVNFDNFMNMDNKIPTKIIINEEDGTNRKEDEEELLSNVMVGATSTATNTVALFYEYTPPTDHLLQFFKTNQDAWFEYKELLEKLEINTLRCEIYICVLGDLLMSHPHLHREEVITDALTNLWNYLSGTVITNKYVQSICLRVCCKLALSEYAQFNLNQVSNEELFLCMNKSATRLRALFEMCFLISPATYNCVQDFKKISTFKITNINSHDKIFLFSFFSTYPSMSETNLFIFHQTFEEAVVKTSAGVLKHKLKTSHFSNMLTVMIFTILHKASIPFLMEHFPKYIKWLLLIMIERGFVLTHRSNLIELVFKIVQIYLSKDLGDIKVLEKKPHEKKEVKRRGRKKKVQTNEQEKVERAEGFKEEETELEMELDQTTYRPSDATEKEIENINTLCMKSANVNVNATIKELRSMFILINFCIHASDILKSKHHVRYFEILKEHIEKQIEEIKSIYIKNNWVGSNNTDEEHSKCSNETGRVFLDLQKMEEETDDDIYNEIIEEYATYIGLLDSGSRDFAYSVIPNDIKNQGAEDELTKEEIMNQINDPNFNEQLLQNSIQKPVKRRRGRRRKSEVERERIMKERQNNKSAYEKTNIEKEKNEEYEIKKRKDTSDINEKIGYNNNKNNSPSTNHRNHMYQSTNDVSSFPNEDKIVDNGVMHNKENKSPVELDFIKKSEKNRNNSNNGSTPNTCESVKEGNQLLTNVFQKNGIIRSGKTNFYINLTSSNTEESDEYTSEDESENEKNTKNLKDNNCDIRSDSSMSSCDSTRQAFKRLNKLKRTSYINFVSK